MTQILKVVDAAQKQLQLGEHTVTLEGSLTDLVLQALKAMLPAEKMAMMAPTTIRTYTFNSISAADYEGLTQLVAEINQALEQEVLRTISRPREPGSVLQAKIMLGEKSVVKSVQWVNE